MEYEMPSDEGIAEMCRVHLLWDTPPSQEGIEEVVQVLTADEPTQELDDLIKKGCLVLRDRGRISDFAELSLARTLVRSRAVQVSILKDVNRAIHSSSSRAE